MDDYLPSNLPPVASVEVVDLRGVDPSRFNNFMKAAGDAPCVKLHGPPALRIAQLWRDLPAGFEMRCHNPPIGLRFVANGKIICQGSICWECNNILGDFSGEPFAYDFDPEAPESKTLLKELQQIIGK